MNFFKKKNNLNFLDHLSKDDKQEEKKSVYLRLEILVYAIIFIIGVFIVLSIPYFSTLGDIYKKSLETADNLKTAKQYLSDEQFKELSETLAKSNENLNQILADVYQFKFFEHIPILESDYFAATQLLRAVILSTSALDQISSFVDETGKTIGKDPKISISDLSEAQKKELLAITYKSAPFLQGIKSELDLAILSLNQINQVSRYASLEKFIPIEKINLIRDIIDDIVPLAQPLTIASGFPQEKTYLLLFQNNSELRPTGGFIGTYGIMKVENGTIKYMTSDDVYNLDKNSHTNIEPPAPIEKYLNRKEWTLRDANWDPDFAETGKRVIEFYNQEGGKEKIDGVIAITPTFIESLLNLTGPMYVEGVEFKAENFTQQLENEVEMNYYKKGIEQQNRKDIIGKLTKVLVAKLFQIPKERWADIGGVIEDNLKQKQILVYFVNPSMQSAFSSSNWTGEIHDYYGDYAMLVDANLAALKTDLVMKKNVEYQVSLDQNNNLIAKYIVQYANTGDFSWWSTRYRTYTRLYVPLGSKLISSSGAMENDKVQGDGAGKVDTYEEHGKTVFGTFISIEPKETGQLVFEYQLPEYIKKMYENGQYNLYAQKQPGTINIPFSAKLNFNNKIKYFYPADLGATILDKKILNWNTDLSEDREVRVKF